MSRVYNFSAGPAVMPEEVLREASEEMMDYRGCGMSVMEMSHRSKDFQDILKEAEQDSAGFNGRSLIIIRYCLSRAEDTCSLPWLP